MKKEKEKELLEAMNTIKLNCERLVDCKDCIFRSVGGSVYDICRLSKSYPEFWEIEIPEESDKEKYSDEDMDIVNSLFEIGATTLWRKNGKIYCDLFRIEMPESFFKPIKEGMIVSIIDIIEECEEEQK